MLDSVHLRLLVGQVNPLPAPRPLLDALESVEVEVHDVGQSGFSLTFSIDKRSSLNTFFLLTNGQPLLFMRVVIVAVVNGVSNVLMDGVITNNRIAPGDKGSNSTMTLMGTDLTTLMDLSAFTGRPHPATSAEARVSQILSKYQSYGVKPQVIPSVWQYVPPKTEQVPVHKGTDLAYVQTLAREAGYVFYIEPGPALGSSTGYWGPQKKVGPVQPALSCDMDAYTNVERMSFSFEQRKNRMPTLINYQFETGDSKPIQLPDTTLLNPELGQVPPATINLQSQDSSPYRPDLAKKPLPLSQAAGLSKAADDKEAVSCSGGLDVTRYGTVLKARQLVGVRGAGVVFDGLYYVKDVTHKIKRGEYRQDFTLTRNGLVSTVPTVTP